jgi:hypothetical protein
MKLPRPPQFEIFDSAPETLRVFVDYYNADHKAKLTKRPYPASIRDVAGKTIEIPTQDFLAYYLFWKQRHRPDLYSHLTAVRADHLYEAAGELNNLITLRSGTLASESGLDEGNTTATGRLGEAMSLCVLNKIHDTGPGDWIALPEKRDQIPSGLKPMDFRIQTASDGKQVLQVECKGSFLPRDPAVINDAVQQQARRIARKKKTHEEVPEASSGIWQADLRYGTITTFGQPGTADAHCWLLDPPTEGRGHPATVRLIARLLYATNLLQLVAPRADLTIALVNRVSSLLAGHRNIEDYDKKPLLRANGKPYSDLFKETASDGDTKSRFLATRTRVDGYPAGGVVVRKPDHGILFFGVREDLISYAVLQDFEAIQEYSAKSETMKATVHAVIPTGEAIAMGVTSERRATSGLYQYLSFDGRLLASSSGFLFGTLQPVR